MHYLGGSEGGRFVLQPVKNSPVPARNWFFGTPCLFTRNWIELEEDRSHFTVASATFHKASLSVLGTSLIYVFLFALHNWTHMYSDRTDFEGVQQGVSGLGRQAQISIQFYQNYGGQSGMLDDNKFLAYAWTQNFHDNRHQQLLVWCCTLFLGIMEVCMTCGLGFHDIQRCRIELPCAWKGNVSDHLCVAKVVVWSHWCQNTLNPKGIAKFHKQTQQQRKEVSFVDLGVSHKLSGKPKRTWLESLGAELVTYILQASLSTCGYCSCAMLCPCGKYATYDVMRVVIWLTTALRL